jgi:hypothetical protein
MKKAMENTRYHLKNFSWTESLCSIKVVSPGRVTKESARAANVGKHEV